MAKIAPYGEFIQDTLEDKITDYKNPRCASCNECCSMGTMLSKEEYNRIKKYLKTDPNGKQIMQRAKKLIDYHAKQRTIYWMCPLSTNAKRCAIYHMRPAVCREFHCSSELAVNYNREKFEETHEHTIGDLFLAKKKNILDK